MPIKSNYCLIASSYRYDLVGLGTEIEGRFTLKGKFLVSFRSHLLIILEQLVAVSVFQIRM